MGCFSYICSICGEPIVSDPKAEHVTLYSIRRKDNVVVESMAGLYDSYGTVHKDPNSDKWDNYEWEVFDWDEICEGKAYIHAVHTRCKPENYEPIGESEGHDEQGIGRCKDLFPQPSFSNHTFHNEVEELKPIYEIFECEDDCYEVHDLSIPTPGDATKSASWLASTKTYEMAEEIVKFLTKE